MEKIVIDKRNRLEISLAKEIDEYGEKNMKVTLSDGVKLAIFGSGLKIISFSKESGTLIASGEITEIKYLKKPISFVKRVFK